MLLWLLNKLEKRIDRSVDMKTKKRHYSKAEKLTILKTETYNMTPVDIKMLAQIFDYLSFIELKRVARAATIMSKGTD